MKKHKQVISIGLKDITKTDIEIKSRNGVQESHHIIGSPNYELIKSKLITRALGFGLQEVEIPFAGPKNSLFEALLSRRYATSEKVAETLKDLVSQLTRLYQVSIQEREQYVALALEKITKEYHLEADKRQELEDDIKFILTDGIKKTFRDNIGRQIPVPEASSMAGLITIMITKMTEHLNAGKSLINVSKLTQLIRDYALIERRAFLASSEFDKRQTFDELTELTEKISSDTFLCLLVKNRLEYTTNASSQTIKMSMVKYGELLNTPVLDLKAFSVDTSVKVLGFNSPLLDNAGELDRLDMLRLPGVLYYIDEVMGAVTINKSTSDLVRTIFASDEVKGLRDSSTTEDVKRDASIVRELHMLLFKMELLKMSAQSFTTIPPFNSTSLSKVTQSLNAKLDVYTIEPFVIALDNAKLAYVSSFKQCLALIRPGLTVPSDSELGRAEEMRTQEPVFKLLLTTDHASEYKTFVKDATDAHALRKTTIATMSNVTESSWRLGRIVKNPATGTHLVMRSILYDVESHLEESVDVITDDGTMTDEEIISIMTGASGKFTTSPYQVYRYSFGSPDLDEYFSYISMESYDSIREAGLNHGISPETEGKVVMLDASKSELHEMVRQKLGAKNERFWAYKLPLYAIFLPKVQYKLHYHDPFADAGTTVLVNSPLLQVGVTTIKDSDVNRIMANYVKDNVVHSVIGNTWPAISTRVTPIADLQRNKWIASLMPSEPDRVMRAKSFNFSGSPELKEDKKADPKTAPLIDFSRILDTEGNERESSISGEEKE